MSIQIGLVGYGYWGPNLLRNLFENSNCEVVYACDKDIVRLEGIKKRYPTIKLTTNFDDLITDPKIKGVVIAVPTKFHYTLAKRALLNNKDVLVEKPFTLTTKEAKELVDIANKQKRILMVDNTFLFNESIIKIKDLIDKGEIGDILYIDSIRVNLGLFQDDINVIFDLATHDFSITQYLIGTRPVKVQAFAKSHFNKQEDVANITAEYKGGVFANVHVSWLSPLKVRRMQIIGTKKMIVYDDIEQSEKIKIFDKGVDIERGLTKKLELNKISYRSGDVWLPNIRNVEALSSMIGEFVKAIDTRKLGKSSGKFTLDVMQILEKATQSARMRKAVDIK